MSRRGNFAEGREVSNIRYNATDIDERIHDDQLSSSQTSTNCVSSVWSSDDAYADDDGGLV